MQKFSPTLAKAVTTSETTGREAEVDCGTALLLFAEASELARSGYYQDAEILVRQSLCHASAVRPALWSLLAKIYAQQGRYIDAESCWREALILAPGTLEYVDGIRAVARLGQRRPIATGLKWLVAALAFAVFGYVGMAVHEYLQNDSTSRTRQDSREDVVEDARQNRSS